MLTSSKMLTRCLLQDLTITDAAAFRRVPYYAALRDTLIEAKYRFRVLQQGARAKSPRRWDRALFLNLAYWGTDARDGDILPEARIPADVVAHAAWHHLVANALHPALQTSDAQHSAAAPSAQALFFGEAVASAFDVFMMGILLQTAPNASFLKTEIPAMSETAQAAGLSQAGFARLLSFMAERPALAFGELWQLLFSLSEQLFEATDANAALAILNANEAQRFAPILHRFEFANWVLYARAHTRKASDPRTRALRAA
jgi:hypothetical protein